MKYTALIFDMDGTIVHNMPIHNQAWKETLAEAGVQIDMDEFHRTTVGKKTHKIMRFMLGTERSEADLLYWGERKELLYRERFSAFRQPMPGLLSLLEQAQSSGLSMAIASAAPPENISFILDELDLRRFFKVVVGGNDIEHGKPDPEIFIKAAKGLKAEPSSCLVFEDALAGIEGAHRAGMDAVFICTTHTAHEVAGMSHVLSAIPDFTYVDIPKLLENSTPFPQNSQT
jgi:beta-phosphoglucomutase family hydrolase